MGYRTPQLPPLLCALVAARCGHLPRVGTGPLRLGARVQRCSAYRGPRLPPPSRGRVPPGRAGVRRGAAVCGGGEARCVRLSLRGPPAGPPPRPLPSRAAAGGLPRGHWVGGPPRLVGGVAPPGRGSRSRAGTGWLDGREAVLAVRAARGGGPVGGAGPRGGSRSGGRGRPASQASRDRPRGFPGGPSAPEALASSARARAPPPRAPSLVWRAALLPPSRPTPAPAFAPRAENGPPPCVGVAPGPSRGAGGVPGWRALGPRGLGGAAGRRGRAGVCVGGERRRRRSLRGSGAAAALAAGPGRAPRGAQLSRGAAGPPSGLEASGGETPRAFPGGSSPRVL